MTVEEFGDGGEGNAGRQQVVYMWWEKGRES